MGLKRLAEAKNDPDKYPSVCDLGWPVTVFDGDKLVPGISERQYNNSIAFFGGEFLMSYRIHGPDKGKSQVGFAHLGEKDGFKIKKTYVIHSLPSPRGTEHNEDARLFEHDGKLWITYTEVRDYSDKPWRCSQRLCSLKLEGGEYVFDSEVKIRYGKNDIAQEKNWQFFSKGGELYFIYSITPHRVCHLDLKTGTVDREWVTPGVTGWRYGSLSGGTPPLLIGDRYITFFHGFLPHAFRSRRYNMSAYEFSTEAPFEILRVSQEPLAFGSAKDGYSVDPRFTGWAPLVTFPSGLVFHNGYLVSVGVNDHLSTLFSMPVDVVEKSMGPTTIKPLTGPRRFITDNFNFPIKVFDPLTKKPRFYSWKRIGDSNQGEMVTSDIGIINSICDIPSVREVPL